MKPTLDLVSPSLRQTVYCPNCGKRASRQQYRRGTDTVIETACPACDYLLVNCQDTGRVMDSYLSAIRQT